MTPLQFKKGLEEAKSAQKEIDRFFKRVSNHFMDLEIYEVGITHCPGDGFLFMHFDSVYQLTDSETYKLFKMTTEEEVYSFFDELEKSNRGI